MGVCVEVEEKQEASVVEAVERRETEEGRGAKGPTTPIFAGNGLVRYGPLGTYSREQLKY